MSIFAVRFGFALAVVALVLGGRPAHAQSAPVTYWTPGWIGFGGNLNAGEGTKADGDFRGFALDRAPIFKTAGLSAVNAAAWD